MRTFDTLADLVAIKGEEIGASGWVTVDQATVNLFADATGDHQWIHVDPERAAQGPFGGPIAHGFLTLSLLPRLWSDMYTVNGITMGVNYGLNKVRFVTPVPVDSRVRAVSQVLDVETVSGGATQVTLATTIEIDGSARPACVAESVVRYYV
jgi:acyl dehydratase